LNRPEKGRFFIAGRTQVPAGIRGVFERLGLIMYAIIVDGGRQYKVTEGQELVIDYRDASSGDAVQFDQVVAYSNGSKLKLGEPTVGGATVTAKVLGVLQGPKLTVQKFRRRKTYRRKTGHRQLYTKVQIEKITAGK
jgi:large subunit ribosomal protein L21